MNYEVESFCGYYLIKENSRPVLLCQGLTNAQTIVKIMESDINGDVSKYCRVDDLETNSKIIKKEQKPIGGIDLDKTRW